MAAALVDEAALLKALREQFERVTGRPLAAACPPWCSCRGVTDSEAVEDR